VWDREGKGGIFVKGDLEGGTCTQWCQGTRVGTP